MGKLSSSSHSETGIDLLTLFEPGECGVITDLGAGKSSSRLQSMGICLGRKIEVVKNGDPLILKVYGTRIGLSERMASNIQMRKCTQPGRCWELEGPHESR